MFKGSVAPYNFDNSSLRIPGPTAHKIDKLIRQAQHARSTILKYGTAAFTEMGLDPRCTVEMGDTKTPQRIYTKSQEKYDGDVSLVKDVCRERGYIHTEEDIAKIRSFYNASRKSDFHRIWEEKGVILDNFDDHFLKPKERGFPAFDIKLMVNLGKGRRLCTEFQIVHDGMRETLETTHRHYEIKRFIIDRALAEGRKMGALEQEIIERLDDESSRLHRESAQELGLAIPSSFKHETPQLRLVVNQ